ncbi:hypothetical protein BBR47_43210 [Brevibacillus brevis NBRC 100599]|uniref:Uncharacterized protein n=1 Tax=Brevibacillus brevis (strain 47 / JCM 6285 / NBRC 100599) TaxID=358681 RepID=C0ZI24_BREBN|nr:hypothetical protein BBR47_43210 [Brevibacillus brevis NBRC 100599]
MEAPICWQGSVLHSAYDSRISPVWMPVYPSDQKEKKRVLALGI